MQLCSLTQSLMKQDLRRGLHEVSLAEIDFGVGIHSLAWSVRLRGAGGA
jgi:hypothetical protein